LVGAASVRVLAVGAPLAEPSHTLATECPLRETKAIILIEDRGAAGDIPSDKLATASFAIKARWICYEGRIDEVLALYDPILSLGPVVATESH